MSNNRVMICKKCLWGLCDYMYFINPIPKLKKAFSGLENSLPEPERVLLKRNMILRRPPLI